MLEFRGGGDYLAAERNFLPHSKREKICYASDIGYHKRKLKKGFTLAEVLITLGIIGVVAAMTMPALIGSYKRMVLKNQYKKLYSTLSQAYNKSIFDIGGVSDCYHYDINNGVQGSLYNKNLCHDFREALEKNLKIAKICTTKAADNGCLLKDQYKGLDTLITDKPDYDEDELNNVNRDCYGFTKNNIHNNNLVYLLADGSIVISFSADSVPISMLIDVNGQKGPNKWGHDLFKLSFVKDRYSYKFSPYGCGINSYEEGGISSVRMWQEMHN